MENEDHLSNPELKKHLESKAVLTGDDRPVCNECNEKIQTGDIISVVSWTPPAHTVANTVDRNFHRQVIYCEKHADGGRTEYNRMANSDSYKENDIVFFTCEIVKKYNEIRFTNIIFQGRSTPDSWD
jgi:hypothetical protein